MQCLGSIGVCNRARPFWIELDQCPPPSLCQYGPQVSALALALGCEARDTVSGPLYVKRFRHVGKGDGWSRLFHLHRVIAVLVVVFALGTVFIFDRLFDHGSSAPPPSGDPPTAGAPPEDGELLAIKERLSAELASQLQGVSNDTERDAIIAEYETQYEAERVRLEQVRRAREIAAGEVSQASESGFLAFEIPKTMQTGRSANVGASIRKTLVDQISQRTKSELAATLPGDVPPDFFPIDVSEVMIVRLYGDEAFNIEENSSPRQALRSSQPTSWRWTVVPLRSGLNYLSICVTIEMAIPDHDPVAVDDCSFERSVEVQINPVYSLKKFGIENPDVILGGGSLIGVIAWMARRVRKRLGKDEK